MSGADRLRRPKALAAEPWRWGLFKIMARRGPPHVYGSVWRTWGIHRPQRGEYVVTHLPTGRRVVSHHLAAFDELRIARRFCETIDGLTDWSEPDPAAYGPELLSRVQRAALSLSRARPRRAASKRGRR